MTARLKVIYASCDVCDGGGSLRDGHEDVYDALLRVSCDDDGGDGDDDVLDLI